MGLCKCPKRKTTSHFCFHHCVNVCEHCIVNNHTTCVVKSYTTWLKEASGSSSSSSVSVSASCAVCQKLVARPSKEIDSLSTGFHEADSSSNTTSAIRLLCYHVIHAHCLSVYTKKLLKEGNKLKCPSCARPLWLQNDSNGTTEVDSNELSPVALQLYKYLHSKWWGQALITNRNIEDIDKHLFEDDPEDTETQLLLDQSISESTHLMNVTSSHNSLHTPDHQTQLTNGYNSPELVHSVPNTTTINHRSNSHQTFQRNFNNNYGRDLFIPQQQQECLSISMSMTSNSDLSNRHNTAATTPLLLNNNSNLNEKQDPSEKYRPKKIYNQSWWLSCRRLFRYFTGSNTEEYSTKKVAIIVVLCICIIVILLVAITSYTRSINEPFDMNSIDYGGEDEDGNHNAAAQVKSYNINNL